MNDKLKRNDNTIPEYAWRDQGRTTENLSRDIPYRGRESTTARQGVLHEDGDVKKARTRVKNLRRISGRWKRHLSMGPNITTDFTTANRTLWDLIIFWWVAGGGAESVGAVWSISMGIKDSRNQRQAPRWRHTIISMKCYSKLDSSGMVHVLSEIMLTNASPTPEILLTCKTGLEHAHEFRISLVSLYGSVFTNETSRRQLNGFSRNLISEGFPFLHFLHTRHFWSKSDKNTGHFTWKPTHVSANLSKVNSQNIYRDEK